MLELKNRFIFAPVKTGFSDGSGKVTAKHISFYTARAQYMGAITPEPFYMDKTLREIPTQMGIDSDDKIDGLKMLVDAIHDSGTKVIAHLSHPGRMVNPAIDGNIYISSTDRPCENGGAIPKRMDRDDMDKVVEMFVNSALRAKKTGFDLIELQFGHGYLLSQFISPAVNDREDEYGGDFYNRIRFPLEVLQAVRNTVAIPLIARISADEMIPDGIKLLEMIKFSKILEDNGINAIHVSAGTICSTPPWFFQHMFVPKGKTWDMAKEIKEQIDIPVIFVGKINSFTDIERVQNEYSADYIAIGRPLVADPEFVGKYLGEVSGRERPCLACSDGCLGGVRSGKGIGCVVNPLVGNDSFRLEKAKESRHYAVVGGGLAGMETALILKRRGHSVTIYEANKLGGQFNLAYLPPGKENLKRVVDYYVSEIKDNSIDVIYKEVYEEDLLKTGYDGVVIATGSRPVVPRIEGLKEFYWAEVMEDENLFENKKALIIGGGLIGVEVAHKLLKKNNEVIIVEMFGDIARGMEMIERTLTLKAFKEKGVSIYLNTRVTKVEGKRVYTEGDTNTVIDNVDHVIMAAGMKSYNLLEEKLKGKIPIYVVGDAKKVGKAQDAIKHAFDTAKGL